MEQGMKYWQVCEAQKQYYCICTYISLLCMYIHMHIQYAQLGNLCNRQMQALTKFRFATMALGHGSRFCHVGTISSQFLFVSFSFDQKADFYSEIWIAKRDSSNSISVPIPSPKMKVVLLIDLVGRSVA